MPRVLSKRECQFCHSAIDIRGHKVHELTCKDRPAESDVEKIDSELKSDNLQVLMNVYRDGLQHGIELGKKAA